MQSVRMSPVLLWLSACAAVLCPIVATQSTRPVNVSFPEVPPASARYNVVQDNFIGISFELSSFNTLWGEYTNTIPNAIQNYLSNIRARITHPLRIRVGGNGMDGSSYVPSQEVMINVTDPNAYFNDVPVTFGPLFFDVLNAMYDRVGSMQFIIGLSMRNPQNDENVVLLADTAKNKLGDRLDAMLLGNEPDLYAGHGNRQDYSISDYILEIGKVMDDLRYSSSGNIISDNIIGGPTICCQWDLDDVINQGLDQYPFKYYTLQHYPQNNCNGPSPQNSNISFFLSHMNVESFVTWNKLGIDLAKEVNVPALLTEYNTVSCGGSNISSTFAAGLWAVDAGLKSAANNFTAVYLHTREQGVTYNLFDPPVGEVSTQDGWRTGSTYYSTLILAEIISATGSVVVDLNLDQSITSPSATVAGYGVYDNNGTTRGKLVLFNFANDSSTRAFKLPANVTDSVGLRLFSAPSVEETTTISWAGQTVGRNGDLEGVQSTEYTDCKGGCTILVPGPGLAMVLFDPRSPDTDNFYEGNSTIAGLTGYLSNALSISRPSSLVLVAVIALCSWVR